VGAGVEGDPTVAVVHGGGGARGRLTPPSQQAVVEQRYMEVDEENVEPLRDAPWRRMPPTPALVRRGGSRATGEVGKDASRLLV
jgi:hypothetical protein